MAKKDIKNAHCNKLAGKQFYPKRDSTQLAGKKAGVPVLVSLQVLLLWGGVRLWGASRKTSAPRVGLSPPAVTPLLTPRLQGSKRRVMSKYCHPWQPLSPTSAKPGKDPKPRTRESHDMNEQSLLAT